MLALLKRLILCLVFLPLLVGTAYPAENARKHPDLTARITNIKTILLLPTVKMSEILAGGVKEYREEWSSQAKENVTKAVVEHLKGKQIEAKTLAADQAPPEALTDVQALYGAVSSSIRLHTYGDVHLFPEKLREFDYSVGSIDTIAKDMGIDAILFIDAVDEISTAGRKALMTAGVVAGALIGIIPVPQRGINTVSLGLVDASGTVLWFTVRYDGGDLREPGGASQTVTGMLAELTGAGR